MRILCGGESVRPQPRLVSAGLLLGAVLEVLRASGIDWSLEDGALALAFNQWTASTLAVLSTIWCLGWALDHSAVEGAGRRNVFGVVTRYAKKTMARTGASGLAATAILLLAGCYVTGAPLLDTPLSPLSMAVTGFAFGLGIAVCALLWFRCYTRLGIASALVHSALAIGAAGLVRLVMASHDPVTTLLVFAACCLASYAGLTSAATSEPPHEEDGAPPEEDIRSEWLKTARKILPVLWLPLAAACIVGFIQGLVWNPIASQTMAIGPLDFQMLELPLGCLLACAVTLVALRIAPKESQCARLAVVGFPIVMGVLLLYPVIVPGGSLAGDLLGWLPHLCFALVIVFTWQSLLLAHQTASGHEAPVLFCGLAVIALSYSLGLVLIHVVGTGGRELCLALLTAYLVLFCTFLAQETRTEQHGRTSDELRPETFIHRRCDELAAEHGISPRETEVLYYLGRGYNHTYIARKLFVSENTVRTHVRHIYAKLGLSSREELLDLIDESADEQQRA